MQRTGLQKAQWLFSVDHPRLPETSGFLLRLSRIRCLPVLFSVMKKGCESCQSRILISGTKHIASSVPSVYRRLRGVFGTTVGSLCLSPLITDSVFSVVPNLGSGACVRADVSKHR